MIDGLPSTDSDFRLLFYVAIGVVMLYAAYKGLQQYVWPFVREMLHPLFSQLF